MTFAGPISAEQRARDAKCSIRGRTAHHPGIPTKPACLETQHTFRQQWQQSSWPIFGQAAVMFEKRVFFPVGNFVDHLTMLWTRVLKNIFDVALRLAFKNAAFRFRHVNVRTCSGLVEDWKTLFRKRNYEKRNITIMCASIKREKLLTKRNAKQTRNDSRRVKETLEGFN